MNKMIILVGYLSLFSCGSAPENNSIRDYYEPKCLSCNVTVDDSHIIPPPTPLVDISQEDLMFYYDSSAEYPYPAKSTQICNHTNGTVIISSALIREDTGSTFSASYYFNLVEYNLPQELNINECLDLSVRFLYSTSPRTAILEINTTYQPCATIRVRLSGQVFTF